MSEAVREYAVKGLTREGNTLILRRGFESVERAEDHPVQLSQWTKVWVEEIPPKPRAPDADKPPPFPWSVQWVGCYAYVIDADGRKIASLLGSQRRREHVAAVLHNLLPGHGGAS